MNKKELEAQIEKAKDNLAKLQRQLEKLSKGITSLDELREAAYEKTRVDITLNVDAKDDRTDEDKAAEEYIKDIEDSDKENFKNAK